MKLQESCIDSLVRDFENAKRSTTLRNLIVEAIIDVTVCIRIHRKFVDAISEKAMKLAADAQDFRQSAEKCLANDELRRKRLRFLPDDNDSVKTRKLVDEVREITGGALDAVGRMQQFRVEFVSRFRIVWRKHTKAS